MTSDALTPKQCNALNVVRRFIKEHDYPPTQHELSVLLGLSARNGARDLVHALARKGYVQLGHNISRGLTLTEKGKQAHE